MRDPAHPTDPTYPADRPRIGVVIPIFNVREYLDEALASVARQSVRVDEVVVVDDGSEPPIELSPPTREPFSGLRQLRLPRNQGLAAARNVGARALSPDIDWIAFLDADDVWPANRTAALAAGVSAVADFVFGLMCNTDRALNALGEPARSRMVNAGLIRRAAFERLDGFDETVHMGQPIEFMSRAEQLGMRAVHVGELVMQRRIHGRNMAATGDEQRQAFARVVRAHLARKTKPKTKPGPS